MVKRKMTARRSVFAGNSDTSSETEVEFSVPIKKIKSSKHRSTPYSTHRNQTGSFDQPSTSNAAEEPSFFNTNELLVEDSLLESNCSYPSFANFLQSHSFVEEEDFLSVSRLAEETSRPSISLEVSGASRANLENSSMDQSMMLNNANFLRLQALNLELVSMQHPSEITLHEYVELTVLAGAVSVLGYDVGEDKSVHIFSTLPTGLKKVTSKSSVHYTKMTKLFKRIRTMSDSKKHNNKLVEEFIEGIGSSTTVVAIKKCVLPPQIQFLRMYFPRVFKAYYTLTSTTQEGVLEIDSDSKSIADELMKALTSPEGKKVGHRVLVHGAKQSGKSSLLRYLINTALNKREFVYYMDTDIGQTEFTPPGLISLTKVTKPLLGPPFYNQKDSVKMIFSGSTTPASSPEMYLSMLNGLIQYFKAHFPQEVLFVNTMGWVEGIGDKCFQSIKKNLKPTFLIDFFSPDVCPDLTIETVGKDNVTCIQIPKKEYKSKNGFSAKDLRNFALLSYFGKCQKYYMTDSYINDFQPVRVCWDNIAICVMGNTVPPSRLLEAIDCSVVALCHVDKSLISETEFDFPKTLKNDYDNVCLGYGFVRATDEKNHFLYIVTPVPVGKLASVNALIKGNIMLPDEVFLKQPILNKPLPYTDNHKGSPASCRRTVKKRQFITPKKVGKPA